MLVWHLSREETQYGFPKRSLTGHSHYVQVSRKQQVQEQLLFLIRQQEQQGRLAKNQATNRSAAVSWDKQQQQLVWQHLLLGSSSSDHSTHRGRMCNALLPPSLNS